MKVRKLLLALTSLPPRATRSIGGRGFAWLLGWRDSFVPPGSRIVGGDRIQVGRDFDSRRRIWIEAVESYAGREFQSRIRIGDRFRSSGGAHIGAIGAISIGDDCLLGSGVLIIDHDHGEYAVGKSAALRVPPVDRPLHHRGEIVIGDRVWIGENAVVLGGVTIGDEAVIGAHAIVTSDVPARSVAVGAPARVVKRLEA